MSYKTTQDVIAETIDGMVVVDAGPGTGKTYTVVKRYLNIISRPDVSPKDVLLLTFTNNAAEEMEERIKRKMTEDHMERESKLVMAKTFDSFCLSIVLDSPDLVSGFFGMKERLTRDATMQQNETLNKDYFIRFMDGYLKNHGAEFGDMAIIASEDPLSIMELISNLMSRGLIPLKTGWFGNNWRGILEGDVPLVFQRLKENNEVGSKGGCKNWSAVNDIDDNLCYGRPSRVDREPMPVEHLEQAARQDRGELFDFIHSIYYEYIRQSISDNRLTFNLVAVMAFTVLYAKQSVRDRNSFRYLMVDEFQDTNANQMMISMMILSEPNMCVVGDWKQGIYGFRYVSIENITNFERKAVEYRRFLNDDGNKRVRFSIPEVVQLPLDRNFRSSQPIIDLAYSCICAKGTSEEIVD